MIYCISDIHGQFQAFKLLLKKIKFNRKHDYLYVLGDMVDWGDGSIKTVKYLMAMQKRYNCVKVLLGNHDLMLKDAIKSGIVDDTYAHNGGLRTMREYREETKENQQKVNEFLNSLETEVTNLEVEGRVFHLAHSAPGFMERNTEDMVWARFDPELLEMGGKILVFGHTITKYFHEMYNIPQKEHRYGIHIINRIDKGYIAIDCGAKVIDRHGYQLAAICLNNLKETYVNKFDLIAAKSKPDDLTKKANQSTNEKSTIDTTIQIN